MAAGPEKDCLPYCLYLVGVSWDVDNVNSVSFVLCPAIRFVQLHVINYIPHCSLSLSIHHETAFTLLSWLFSAFALECILGDSFHPISLCCEVCCFLLKTSGVQCYKSLKTATIWKNYFKIKSHLFPTFLTFSSIPLHGPSPVGFYFCHILISLSRKHLCHILSWALFLVSNGKQW